MNVDYTRLASQSARLLGNTHGKTKGMRLKTPKGGTHRNEVRPKLLAMISRRALAPVFKIARPSSRTGANARRLHSTVKYTAMCLATSNSITRLLHCEFAT